MGLRINAGSGQRPFQKPWINVDAQARWEPDLVADCAKLPYGDGECEMVVLSHVLEHFGCGEGLGMIKEAYRLLQPYGSLIVAVPDMRALAQHWLMGKLDTETYFINVYGAYMGNEHDRHKFGFVAETLEKELYQGGTWQTVQKFNWRQIPGMDLAKDWWVLCLEAVR